MHLLDLKATSSWKTGPLTLFQINVDSGELDRLSDSTFTPKTRTLESEKILREQLFRRTQSEEEENEQILDETSDSMSTNLFGGAGVSRISDLFDLLSLVWFSSLNYVFFCFLCSPDGKNYDSYAKGRVGFRSA